MKAHTLSNVRKLMQMKADQSAAAARQSRKKLQEARAFCDQVQSYANEYDQHLVKAGLTGVDALQLQSHADFNARLSATAREQLAQIQPLEVRTQEALKTAVDQHMRLQAMERFIQARALQQDRLAEQAEAKESQDLLQARLNQHR